MPEAKQIYIVGYDTFVRILDKKYYPNQDLANSGLGDFFSHGKLLCAMREDDKWGDSKEQKEHIAKLSAGEVEDVPAEWGKSIDILTLKASEGLGVSSTKIRNAVAANDEAVLSKYLTPGVREVIKENRLYCNDSNARSSI